MLEIIGLILLGILCFMFVFLMGCMVVLNAMFNSIFPSWMIRKSKK